MDLHHAAGNDVALIGQCIAGDENAWRLLFCRHQKQLLKTIIHQLGPGRWHAVQVEEILADVWFVLLVENHQHLRAYDPSRSSFPTYLQALARQQCQRWRQRQARQALHLVPWPNQELTASPSPCLTRGPRWEEFWSALTEAEREFVHECLAAPTPGEESPAISPPSQRKRKQRVLAKLRAVLFSE